MPFPIILGIQAAMAIAELAKNLVDRYNNGNLTQDEFDAEWKKMHTHLSATVDAWNAMNKDA